MAFQYRRASSPVPSLSSSSGSGYSSSSSSSRSSGLPSLLPPNLPQVIPDMRFEQSYLASIRGFVHELDPEEAQEEKQEAKGEKDAASSTIVKGKGPKGEPELWIGRLRIDWLPLIKVTIRDQFLSPLGQGAVWAFVGLFLGSLRTSVRDFLQGMGARRRLARAAARPPMAATQAPRPPVANVGIRAGQAVGDAELR